jgi:hypothetical protein
MMDMPTPRYFAKRSGDRRKWSGRREEDERPSIRGWGKTSLRGALAERELLRALLQVRGQLGPVAERISPQGFRVPVYGRIFATLIAEGEDATVEALAAALDDDAVHVLQNEVLLDPEGITDPMVTIAQALDRLRVREIDDSLDEIERLLPLAAAGQKDALVDRKTKLHHEKRSLGGKSFKTGGFRKRRA